MLFLLEDVNPDRGPLMKIITGTRVWVRLITRMHVDSPSHSFRNLVTMNKLGALVELNVELEYSVFGCFGAHHGIVSQFDFKISHGVPLHKSYRKVQ